MRCVSSGNRLIPHRPNDDAVPCETADRIRSLGTHSLCRGAPCADPSDLCGRASHADPRTQGPRSPSRGAPCADPSDPCGRASHADPRTQGLRSPCRGAPCADPSDPCCPSSHADPRTRDPRTQGLRSPSHGAPCAELCAYGVPHAHPPNRRPHRKGKSSPRLPQEQAHPSGELPEPSQGPLPSPQQRQKPSIGSSSSSCSSCHPFKESFKLSAPAPAAGLHVYRERPFLHESTPFLKKVFSPDCAISCLLPAPHPPPPAFVSQSGAPAPFFWSRIRSMESPLFRLCLSVGSGEGLSDSLRHRETDRRLWPFIMPYRLRVVTSVYSSPPTRAVKSDAASSETGQAVDGSLSGDLNSFLCHELLRRLRREPSTINNHRFKYSSSNSRAVDMLMDCTDPSFYVILRSRMLTIGSGLPDDEISQLPHLSPSHALPCR